MEKGAGYGMDRKYEHRGGVRSRHGPYIESKFLSAIPVPK